MIYVFGCAAGSPADSHHAHLFQTGWFVESLLTQTLIIHVIRTNKIPFLQSRASWPMIMTTVTVMAIGITLPFLPIGVDPKTGANALGLVPLNGQAHYEATVTKVDVPQDKLTVDINRGEGNQPSLKTLDLRKDDHVRDSQNLPVKLSDLKAGDVVRVSTKNETWLYWPIVVGILLSYIVLTQLVKTWLVKKRWI
jgi:magnesium-transporting ATPase (P-type)